MFDFDLPDPGLYRTTQPMPGNDALFPANALVFIGQPKNGGVKFIVRPSNNRRNRWFWAEPTTPLKATHAAWARSLKPLPAEGFYTLPETLNLDGGGKWLKGAIVQLGYNEEGKGIVFVGEWQEDGDSNSLFFSERGILIDDRLLSKLIWAPILPVSAPQQQLSQ
ncbi:MAG TPA: hypothetical protein PKE31_00870 [Pseudomonadota bacterium]|jgi:hypothetical protein|nr:hypothetical protein [Pseudomonadota bacterium]